MGQDASAALSPFFHISNFFPILDTVCFKALTKKQQVRKLTMHSCRPMNNASNAQHSRKLSSLLNSASCYRVDDHHPSCRCGRCQHLLYCLIHFRHCLHCHQRRCNNCFIFVERSIVASEGPHFTFTELSQQLFASPVPKLNPNQ